MIRTRFIGTGHCVPEQVVSNLDLAKRIDTSDEWIRTRTGIRKRHVLGETEATSDIAARAGAHACEAAGISPSEIDCLVVATTTPDMPMPSCAIMTQHKLGMTGPAFDVGAACAGFTYGTAVVDSLIRAGLFRTVLFVGAEALSKFLDWDDRGTSVLFGDGAGAVVAVAEAQEASSSSAQARGILACHLDGDSRYWKDLNIPGGGTKNPPTSQTVAENLHVMNMNGRVVFSQAVRSLVDACETVLAKAGLTPDDVDLVIPHQANLRIIEAVARRIRMPMDRFIVNLDKYGNTSSASIPIALDEAVRGNVVKDGMVLLQCGLGAGLTWGAAVMRW